MESHFSAYARREENINQRTSMNSDVILHLLIVTIRYNKEKNTSMRISFSTWDVERFVWKDSNASRWQWSIMMYRFLSTVNQSIDFSEPRPSWDRSIFKWTCQRFSTIERRVEMINQCTVCPPVFINSNKKISGEADCAIQELSGKKLNLVLSNNLLTRCACPRKTSMKWDLIVLLDTGESERKRRGRVTTNTHRSFEILFPMTPEWTLFWHHRRRRVTKINEHPRIEGVAKVKSSEYILKDKLLLSFYRDTLFSSVYSQRVRKLIDRSYHCISNISQIWCIASD